MRTVTMGRGGGLTPKHLSVRNATTDDIAAIARIHVAAWNRAFRGLIPDHDIALRDVERRTKQWTNVLENPDRLVLVACDETQTIRGFASAIPTPGDAYDGYLQTLYVAPDTWGRGIGRNLLAAISIRLRAAGVKSLALRTLRLAAARRFYENLGARLVPEGIERDAHSFDDVVYAFDDLGTLIERIGER